MKEELFDYKVQKVICSIESYIKYKIVGFRFKGDGWINLVNNAIHHCSEYWGGDILKMLLRNINFTLN
ncbi:DUF6035 family protein [Aquimarina sp. W85]|uniref:DUF7829 domain-containing protein n=1 Tax=Aquimarina rhodophyticola TaxID=3342246 RepID=UPI00366FC0CE